MYGLLGQERYNYGGCQLYEEDAVDSSHLYLGFDLNILSFTTYCLQI